MLSRGRIKNADLPSILYTCPKAQMPLPMRFPALRRICSEIVVNKLQAYQKTVAIIKIQATSGQSKPEFFG